jgi:hypothetical protein
MVLGDWSLEQASHFISMVSALAQILVAIYPSIHQLAGDRALSPTMEGLPREGQIFTRPRLDWSGLIGFN